eukprot:353069-Chlamydomonas_euryale.AAC.32
MARTLLFPALPDPAPALVPTLAPPPPPRPPTHPLPPRQPSLTFPICSPWHWTVEARALSRCALTTRVHGVATRCRTHTSKQAGTQAGGRASAGGWANLCSWAAITPIETPPRLEEGTHGAAKRRGDEAASRCGERGCKHGRRRRPGKAHRSRPLVRREGTQLALLKERHLNVAEGDGNGRENNAVPVA